MIIIHHLRVWRGSGLADAIVPLSGVTLLVARVYYLLLNVYYGLLM